MVLEPINEYVTLGKYENLCDALSTLDGEEAGITALSTLITIGLTEGKSSYDLSKLQKNIDKVNKQYGTDFKLKTNAEIINNQTGQTITQQEINNQILKNKIVDNIKAQEINTIEQTKQELENNFQNGLITEEQYSQEINNLSNRLRVFTDEIKNNENNPITEIEVEKQLLDEEFNNNQITEEEYNNRLSTLDNSLKELSSNNQITTNTNKIDIFRETANEYWDNSKESQEVKNVIEKIIKDKGYNIILDPTIGNNVGGLATTNQNGEVEIRLNPNSNRTVEFLLTHEVTHAIETDEMKNLVMDYASKNTEFNKALESLKQTYNSEDVSSEVLADISGQLLGNQEFILNLSTTKPNIFKRMYDAIISFANKITGNSKEALFVRDLKNKWEEAYRTQNNNLTTSKLSIQTDTKGNKYVNVDTDQDIFKGKSLSEQTKIAKKYILDNFRENGIDMNDNVINVTSKTANEYTHPRNQLPKVTKESKMKASTELDNLLNISEYKYSQPDDGRHPFAKDGWDYYSTIFKVGDNIFTGIVNIGKSGNKKTLYDITKIKRISQNRGTSANAFSTSLANSVTDTISQSNKNVKSDNVSTKYSIQENTNNTKYYVQGRNINQNIINDIKEFQNNSNTDIEGYKGSYIKEMLKIANIKVPSSFDYITEVRPDFSYTTTKNLTRAQHQSIANTLLKLKDFDISTLNNQQSIALNPIWQKFLDDNYKTTGKRTNMADIRRNTKNNTNNNTKQVMEANNIEPDPEIAKILEERPVTKEDTDNKLKKLLTIKIVDKGYYVDKLARQTKNKTLSSTYDYMLMANGIAQQSIGNERFNPKTQQYNGKGLHKIFEPIENSGQLQAFSEYMYHKHNADRMDLEKKYSEENKPVFGDTVTSDVSQKIINKYEKSNPEFKNWAKEVYDYNNFLLDVLVDYGVITNEDKTYYNKKYPHYIPTIRATDKTKVQMDMFGKKASINTPIKTAKGGNQNIIPLKEAMALRTMQTMNSALRNRFGNELYNTINVEADISNVDLDETIGDNIDSDELLTKSTKEKPATLTIFKDGEKTTFNIPDEIYEALAPNKRYKIKAFNTVSQIRRGLLTEYNPAFMLTNPIRDVQDGAINSKHPALFLKNIPEASKQIATKGEYYKQYIANGGSYETYFNYGESYNKLPIKRSAFDPRKILDKISDINQAIEMTPRLAEFISSVEAGDSIETAMYNAQEITTNFKRGGNWTKNLDANGVTFLNASVQGAVKQVRNFQEAKAQGIRGIANLSAKWSIAGLTPFVSSSFNTI